METFTDLDATRGPVAAKLSHHVHEDDAQLAESESQRAALEAQREQIDRN